MPRAENIRYRAGIHSRCEADNLQYQSFGGTLWRTCNNNPHVMNAAGMRTSIYSAFVTPPSRSPKNVEDDIPFLNL
jgi:hypothetical protein